ncbi:MAG: hypothetical protein ACKVW3_14165 [Phycisphaerales bacterium]
MALFGKKKEEGDEPKPNGQDAKDQKSESFKPAPDKAAKWFANARVVHEATNYAYAMQSWLSGLRQEPTSMSGLEGFFKSCAAFLNEGGNRKEVRDLTKDFSGRNDVDKYAASLLQWGLEPADAAAAVRATEAAGKLNMPEPTYWLGERALAAVLREKKPRKELLIKLMEIFTAVGAYEKAVQAGEAAVRLDPSDAKLAADVRNLAAQATMSRGGYENSGQAGGFRQNVRDLDKQRQLEDAERIVKTDETVDRLVREAEVRYRERPEDLAVITVYVKRLLERGRPEDESLAKKLLEKTYESSKQFRFREMYGDIRLRQAARKLADYKATALAAPENEKAGRMHREAQRQFLTMEAEEYKLRVEAYPTDLTWKFELGKRLFDLGQYDDAIALFQKSQEEAKRRVESLLYIGRSFQAQSWIDEAVHSYRQALEVHRMPNDETGMEIRYGLMSALQAKAEAERELAAAEEADKIASGIAIQQINYRDIRARRDAIKKLITELKRGGA